MTIEPSASLQPRASLDKDPHRAGPHNKRARVSLTLRLIYGYLLRSLLPILTFIPFIEHYWTFLKMYNLL